MEKTPEDAERTQLHEQILPALVPAYHATVNHLCKKTPCTNPDFCADQVLNETVKQTLSRQTKEPILNILPFLIEAARTQANKLCGKCLICGKNAVSLDETNPRCFFPIEIDRSQAHPEQALNAKILFEEFYYQKTSDDEKQLLKLIYKGLNQQEMAKELGINYAALRKRLARLIIKWANF